MKKEFTLAQMKFAIEMAQETCMTDLRSDDRELKHSPEEVLNKVSEKFNEKGIEVGDKVIISDKSRANGKTAKVLEVFRDSVYISIKGISEGVLYDNKYINTKN